MFYSDVDMHYVMTDDVCNDSTICVHRWRSENCGVRLDTLNILQKVRPRQYYRSPHCRRRKWGGARAPPGLYQGGHRGAQRLSATGICARVILYSVTAASSQ